MPSYVIFDENGNYTNCIVCDEWDILPDGHTKQKLEDNQYWDFEAQKIKIKGSPNPITIETV